MSPIAHSSNDHVFPITQSPITQSPCSSVKPPVPSSARRAARSWACATRNATTADGAIPGCGDSRRCCEASATISASCRWSSGAAARSTSSRCCSRATRCGMGGGLFGFLAPDLGVLFLLGACGGRAGVRIRPVVDGAERGLAPRQPASHHLQHDVGARSRPGRRRHVRRRADGDHLHGRGRVGIPAQLVRVRVPAAPAVL